MDDNKFLLFSPNFLLLLVTIESLDTRWDFYLLEVKIVKLEWFTCPFLCLLDVIPLISAINIIFGVNMIKITLA